MAEPKQLENRSNKRKNQIEEEIEGANYASPGKRKNRRIEEGNMKDPLVVFGSDIMLMVLSYLDARSVALSLLVCRGWHGVASSDRLWTTKDYIDLTSSTPTSCVHQQIVCGALQTSEPNGWKLWSLFFSSKPCEELWRGKAHIPRMSQVRGLSKLAAYSLSVMDGKRTRIMKEDLWDHVWEFHFNKLAPEYWRNLDPNWKRTGPPMRRYFHPDGSQTADPGDKVWGGHEACYSVVTSFLGDGKIRAHYVRINRWPRMLVSRKQDWGWEMSNKLYSYSSIPDAGKEGGTGPLFEHY